MLVLFSFDNKLLFCNRIFYLQISQFTFSKLFKTTGGMFLVFCTKTQLIIVQMHFVTELPYLTNITILRNHRKYMWKWLSGLGCVQEIRYSLVANIKISGWMNVGVTQRWMVQCQMWQPDCTGINCRAKLHCSVFKGTAYTQQDDNICVGAD